MSIEKPKIPRIPGETFTAVQTLISHGISREAVQTGMDARRATEGPAGILDIMSRSTTERNVVDMPGSAAEAESP